MIAVAVKYAAWASRRRNRGPTRWVQLLVSEYLIRRHRGR